MAFLARAWTDLFFCLLLAAISDPWADRAAGNPSRTGLSRRGGPPVGRLAILVCADAPVVVGERSNAAGDQHCWRRRIAAPDPKPVSACHVIDLPDPVSFLRERGAGFFRIPVRRNVAGGRL